MTLSNTMKAFSGALLLALMLGFTGCKCCAEEQKDCTAAGDCCCPTLLVIQMDGTCTQAQPVCPPCSGKTKDHKAHLCMNAVAACPVYSCMILEAAPLCDGCKNKIMECAKARKDCGVCGKDSNPCEGCKAKLHKMPVKAIISPEAMKAHTNCKKCMEKVQEHVKSAQPPDAVVVVEEEEVEVDAVPVPAQEEKK